MPMPLQLFMIICDGIHYEIDKKIANNQQAYFKYNKEFIKEISLKKGNQRANNYIDGHNLIADDTSLP